MSTGPRISLSSTRSPIGRSVTSSPSCARRRFTGIRFDIVTVAESREAHYDDGRRTHGARRVTRRPGAFRQRAFILPGGDMCGLRRREAFTAAAARFLNAGVPVAAICGATAGLARAGLLDERNHASAAAEYLSATGYRAG